MNEVEWKYCPVTNKRCYESREADRVLARFKKHYRGGGCGRKTPKRKYLCQFCNHYHLTSQMKKLGHKPVKKPLKIIGGSILVMLLMSCGTKEVQRTEVPVTKYTVVYNNCMKYEHLTLIGASTNGVTFRTENGKRITFCGNFLYISE